MGANYRLTDIPTHSTSDVIHPKSSSPSVCNLSGNIYGKLFRRQYLSSSVWGNAFTLEKKSEKEGYPPFGSLALARMSNAMVAVVELVNVFNDTKV